MDQTTAQGGNALIALGDHINRHPELPQIYRISDPRGPVLEIRLMSASDKRGAAVLAAWAATLGDVGSHAYRVSKDQVDGHVTGTIDGYRVDLIGSLPPDVIPTDGKQYEWDVTAQLLEA